MLLCYSRMELFAGSYSAATCQRRTASLGSPVLQIIPDRMVVFPSHSSLHRCHLAFTASVFLMSMASCENNHLTCASPGKGQDCIISEYGTPCRW